MSNSTPNSSTQAPLRFSLGLVFFVSSVIILSLPHIFTNPTAGGLRRLLVALSPILLVFLSIALHALAPSDNNPHLQFGLVVFFAGVVNSVNYLVHFMGWFETWPSTILGVAPSAMLVFIAVELVYYGFIRLLHGLENLGTYPIFHDKLHKHFRKTGSWAVEATKDGLANVYDWVLLCFSIPQAEDAPEESHRIDDQASLPPPYWMNMRLITPATGSSSNLDSKPLTTDF